MRIAFNDTRGAANNARALASQGAAGKVQAGAGLSRGRGQRFADQSMDQRAYAQGQAAFDDIVLDDQYTNAGIAGADAMRTSAAQVAQQNRNAQRAASDWSSRFGNMTTAWGALAGLLR